MFFPNTNNIDASQNPPPLPPNKPTQPTSQKAATMPPEPEEDKVVMLMEISGMDRGVAVRYLKVGCVYLCALGRG